MVRSPRDLRADLTASIAETTRLVEDRDQALTAASDVADIEAQIEPRFANAIVKVKAQLDKYLPLQRLPRPSPCPTGARRARDLTILHEQIDCLKSDQPLRSPDVPEGALASFGPCLRDCGSDCRRTRRESRTLARCPCSRRSQTGRTSSA